MATATPKAKAPERIKMRIKKGDTVQVICGKDKGKTGEVLRTLPYENRVVVQGITGGQARFDTEWCIKYGTRIVAGVTPQGNCIN